MARKRAVEAGFLVVWMTFWASAIAIAVWHLGAAALAGAPAPALFLAIWTVAAGAGLVAAGRKLARMVTGLPERPRSGSDRHRWHDGVAPDESAPSPAPNATPNAMPHPASHPPPPPGG